MTGNLGTTSGRPTCFGPKSELYCTYWDWIGSLPSVSKTCLNSHFLAIWPRIWKIEHVYSHFEHRGPFSYHDLFLMSTTRRSNNRDVDNLNWSDKKMFANDGFVNIRLRRYWKLYIRILTLPCTSEMFFINLLEQIYRSEPFCK